MSTTTSLICNKFGGIRRVSSSFSDQQITCSDCQNVEFFYTGVNSGVGIRTSKGNTSITQYLDNKDLDVYTIEDDTPTKIAENGEINNSLSYTIGGTKIGGYLRDKGSDTIINTVKYFGWVNDQNNGKRFTVKDGTDILSLIPSDENVIGMFESIQGGVTYCFLYTENETKGKIYKFDIAAKTVILMIDTLTPTGNCNGITLAQGWSDQFFFTNGEDAINIEIGRTSEGEPDEVNVLNLVDVDDRPIKGLGFVHFDGRLWIFNDEVLWYSRQEDFDDFHTSDPEQVTSAGYIEYAKDITAIYNYLGSLAVFHRDSSSLLTIESDGTYSKDEDSPGGCASYNSLIFHGTELYFYDDTKKGVFCFKQVVNGDKTLGDNIAIDVQDILCNIDINSLSKIKTLSVVTEDRNEIWVLIPDIDENHSTVLIYDYLTMEWIKRKCQKINGFTIVNNTLYSFGKEVYEEYVGNSFSGEFIPSYYNCSLLNLGMDNSLKILYFPPRVTLDMTRTTEFCCKYIRNYDYLKKSKTKLIKTKSVKNALYWNVGKWNEQKWSAETCNSIYKLSSATFKVLELQLIAQEEGQEFAIKNIEFSKIKVKQI